jgi:hypothetical protein
LCERKCDDENVEEQVGTQVETNKKYQFNSGGLQVPIQDNEIRVCKVLYKYFDVLRKPPQEAWHMIGKLQGQLATAMKLTDVGDKRKLGTPNFSF